MTPINEDSEFLSESPLDSASDVLDSAISAQDGSEAKSLAEERAERSVKVL